VVRLRWTLIMLQAGGRQRKNS